MDAQTTIHKRSAKRAAPRRAAPKQRNGERRRLVQLLVSLCLFLLVFFGGNVFPAQLNRLNEIVRADMEFADAFREIGQALSDGESAEQILKNFGAVISGHQEEAPLATETPPITASLPTPLAACDRLGLEQTAQYGIRPTYSRPDAPSDESAQSTPEPTPQVVTAVAQVYAEDGTKLPSNVSFLYYELGLEETVIPVMGEVTSGFGYRTGPISGKREFHLALDIAAREGTEIQAFSDGVVEYIGESKEFGLYLKLNHANGVSTFYAHCSKLLVRKGDKVTCGQTIALVGRTGNATGSHLHLTILKDDIRLDPAHYVDL